MGRDKRPAGRPGKFIQVDHALLNSPAYIALDRSAQALFIDMRTKFNGYNNGNINAALSELRHRGWTAPTTLAKALRQLEAAGFIAKTRRTVGVENGSKACNLYRFTDWEVYDQPKLNIQAMNPTHDYRKIETLADARQIIRAASAPASRAKNKTTLQKMYRHATENVASSGRIATVSVLTSATALQKM